MRRGRAGRRNRGANSFHCLGTRQWERGAIVIYVTSEQHRLAHWRVNSCECLCARSSSEIRILLMDGIPLGAVDSMTRAIPPRQGTCSNMHMELAARGLLLLGTANED